MHRVYVVGDGLKWRLIPELEGAGAGAGVTKWEGESSTWNSSVLDIIPTSFIVSPFIKACHGPHVVLYARCREVVFVASRHGRAVVMHQLRQVSCSLDSHCMKLIRIC